MKTKTTESDWVSEVGAPAYASITEMVAALECDRDRLEDLRDEREQLQDEVDAIDNSADIDEDAQISIDDLKEWDEENAEELAELISAATLDGEEVSEDDARERIQEDALSVRIFGERIDGEWQADRFELLLTTGGPAVRIMGELDANNEPDRAWLEVQDWGKPWTQYFLADQDTLLTYCRCFCFE